MQVLSGVRVVKLLHWEPPYSEWINSARLREMRVVKAVASLKAVNEGLFFCSTHLIAAAVFLTYTLTGGDLTSQIIFTTLSLFSLLQ